MSNKFRLFFSFYLFFSIHCFSSDVIKYHNSILDISSKVQILEDPNNSLLINEVIKSGQFKSTNQAVPNLQISISTFWIKFTLQNFSDDNNLALELSSPLIDSTSLYTIDIQSEYKVEHTGEYVPIFKRKYHHQNYIFDLDVPTGETKTFILKIKASEQIQLPLKVSTPVTILHSLLIKDLLFGIYAGIILVMFLYNLFIYITVKDNTYLYYVAYIILVGLTQASLEGYAFKFLWPDSPILANLSMVLAPALTGVAAIEFLIRFLNIKATYHIYYKVLKIFTVIYLISILIGFLGYYQLSQQIIQLNGMAGSLIAFAIAYVIAKKGNRSATYFLIAWSIFLISVIIFALRNFNILEYNALTIYSLQIGSGLEVILLSFALADRINILKREKVDSQKIAIDALEANKRLITLQNLELETKVKNRTSELESAYKNLQNTQSQLVDSEKMASLGQLTAGIAHEINNPINFVVSNITPLRRDINDILELVEKYEKISIENGLEEKLTDIRKFRKEIDVDFVKEEIEMLLNGISEGASRTSEIIRSLRNFSRVDESDLKTANINEGILSTLVLLSQQFDKITVVKYIGDLPKIDCYPGKLNQAFMNIITNAIQALHNVEGARIEISTFHLKDEVIISIKDNGTGMSEEIRAKIFDPFFTTKDVGKGTGLGLSITYGIIEKHKGKIEVNSTLGSGTEFVITLPVKRTDMV